MKLSDIDLHSEEEIDDAIDLLRVRKEKFSKSKDSSVNMESEADLKALIIPLEDLIKGMLSRLDEILVKREPIEGKKKGGIGYRPSWKRKTGDIPVGWLRVADPNEKIGEVYLHNSWDVECGINRYNKRENPRKRIMDLEDPESPGSLLHHSEWFDEKKNASLRKSFRIYHFDDDLPRPIKDCLIKRENLYRPVVSDLP